MIKYIKFFFNTAIIIFIVLAIYAIITIFYSKKSKIFNTELRVKQSYKIFKNKLYINRNSVIDEFYNLKINTNYKIFIHNNLNEKCFLLEMKYLRNDNFFLYLKKEDLKRLIIL